MWQIATSIHRAETCRNGCWGEWAKKGLGEIVLDDENVNCNYPFHLCANFQPSTKFQLNREDEKPLLGENMSTKNAVREHFHDTIYCHSFETIARRVDSLWKDYKEGAGGHDAKYAKATKAYKESE